jgi:hypothetical protein
VSLTAKERRAIREAAPWQIGDFVHSSTPETEAAVAALNAIAEECEAVARARGALEKEAMRYATRYAERVGAPTECGELLCAARGLRVARGRRCGR